MHLFPNNVTAEFGKIIWFTQRHKIGVDHDGLVHPRSAGREADGRREIPMRGLKDVLWRVWVEVSDQNLFLIAGGVTHAVPLALFPGLAALVSLFGLVFDAGQIERQAATLSAILPVQTRELLIQALHNLVQSSRETLGLAAIVAFLLPLWSTSHGMSGLITALNIAYDEKERRGFFRLNLIALGLTFGLLIGCIMAIALLAVLPATAQVLAVGPAGKWSLLNLQWPLLILLVMVGRVVAYRFARDGDEPQWRWVSPGAITATILCILSSVGFTIYVANFNGDDETYDSLGGVVILLTWLFCRQFIMRRKIRLRTHTDNGAVESRMRCVQNPIDAVRNLLLLYPTATRATCQLNHGGGRA